MQKNVLSINKLCFSFGEFAIKDVSFNIKAGDIVGFVGRNGAGKSTTINTILGVKTKTSGEVVFNGEIITDKNIAFFRQKVGYVGECNQYYFDTKVKRIVKILSKLYSEWDSEVYNYYVKEIFKIDVNKKIKELSSGNRVRLNIAMALSHNADLLILDEPTSGVDPVIRSEILKILQKFVIDSNKAILFSTHISEDIEQIATRILCISDGEIKFDVEKDENAGITVNDIILFLKGESKYDTFN